MPPYDQAFKPVALPGQFLQLLPQDEVREVLGVEPVPYIGPVDFGSVAAGGSSGPANNEVTELEMNANQVGQFRIHVLSNVEIEFRQDGQQDQRYTNANSIGQFTPSTPPNANEFYMQHDGNPFLVITNPNTYQVDKTLVAFNGFKLNLDQETLTPEQAPRQPVTFPVDKLERQAQTAGSGGGGVSPAAPDRRAR